MSDALIALTLTAVSIGFVHTLLGPDHYVPFIVMARVRRWSLTRTAVVTVLCGVGHVASSVVLGLIGIALGVVVARLEGLESIRGDVAAWALIAFGLAYCAWGVRRAWQNRPHTHRHGHDAAAHSHEHTHRSDHAHVHDEEDAQDITPWILFTVFVLGPCEPLIPILMYPAVESSLWGLCIVTAAFAVTTISTMLAVVLAAAAGLRPILVTRLARYGHAMAGMAILVCGVAIKLGL